MQNYGSSPGNPGDVASAYASIRSRPTESVPIPAGSGSKQLTTRPCILVGWSLREATGAASAIVEFIDGGDATGTIVGESAIPAPLAGQGGITDTDVDANSANPAAANNVTLPGVAGQTTFITGFEVTGAGATAASEIVITITGLLGGTETYDLAIPAGAGAPVGPLQVEFARPRPASGPNTAIVVNVPSFGAGNLNAAVTAHGFQRAVGASGANDAQADTQILQADGPFCRVGLFMRLVSGAVIGSVWIKT